MVSAEVTCDPCVDFKKAREAEAAAAASAAGMEPEPEPAEDAAAEAAAAREQRAAQLAPPASPEAAPSGPDATLSAEDGALVVEELERQQGLLIRELSNDPENDDLSEKVKEVTVRLARVASSHDLSLSGPAEPEAEEPAGPDPDSEEWAPYYSELLKELIDTVPLLASLGITEPDFTWRLGLQLQSRAFAAGATVLTTGERSSELFFLARGAVRIPPSPLPIPIKPLTPRRCSAGDGGGRDDGRLGDGPCGGVQRWPADPGAPRPDRDHRHHRLRRGLPRAAAARIDRRRQAVQGATPTPPSDQKLSRFGLTGWFWCAQGFEQYMVDSEGGKNEGAAKMNRSGSTVFKLGKLLAKEARKRIGGNTTGSTLSWFLQSRPPEPERAVWGLGRGCRQGAPGGDGIARLPRQRRLNLSLGARA